MGFFQKIGQWMRRFMAGRYGSDKLNTFLLVTGVVTSLTAAFVPFAPIKLIMVIISYILLFISIFRLLSRNTYRRYRENRKFLQMVERFRDRQHRYYDCPRCHQQVRVPRGKGKISITCPKCKEKFIRKT